MVACPAAGQTTEGTIAGRGLGSKGPTGDVYTLPHLQWDAQASIRLGHGRSAVVYGLNLTDEVFGYYTGSPIFVDQREFYEATHFGRIAL